PKDAPSTVALNVLFEQFKSDIPSLRLYIPDISVTEAGELEKKLAEADCVDEVLWLGDMINIKEPLEIADADMVDEWYLDGGALFMLAVNDNLKEADAIKELRGIAGEKAAFSGDAADRAAAQESVTREVTRIMAIVIPIILIILLLTTNSWISPILFAIVIIVSIILNMGTNIIFGRISFLTQTIAPILQLAVSMDYSIFLLNSFDRYKAEGHEAKKAMALAVKETASTIVSSAATTFAGFIVLCLMKFGIGPDLGFVLAKGIVLSMVTSLFLLPAAALAMNRALERTAHRRLLPSFKGFGRFVGRIKIPILILVLLVILPCYLAQRNNNFTYGAAGVGDGSRFGEDAALVEEKFGAASQLILLVPRGEVDKEIELTGKLERLEGVRSVMSYVNTVGVEIPAEFLTDNELSQFISEDYSRFIISVSTPSEGDEAFELVRKIRQEAGSLYGDNYHFCGASVNNLDIKQTVEKDNQIVTISAIFAIGIILLITFRSLTLPLILLLTIEAAIWINLSFPYFFSDNPMHFIAYLIVNTVQLGATIDYAILFTENYLTNRATLGKKASVIKSVSETTPSILVSALILILAGISLNIVSSNYIVSEFGTVLSRGAVCSALLVLILLPSLLVLFDKIIKKTTSRKRTGGQI
ncbi:MAG: MMPL family transporter, partial [Clostridiales bacterium]|nr:MMPL family transporter [Clostridiales bacterium]